MNRFPPINPTIALAVLLTLLVATPMSAAANSDKSTKSADSAATPAGKGEGDSAGSMAIESTIFAYAALAADADKLAQAISPKVSGQVVVIATPADFTSLVQWRIVMAQADLLHGRARSTLKSLTDIPIPPEFAGVTQKGVAFGAGPVPSAADIQTLVQTAASISAVNESLSVASAALTTTPLANLLAARLSEKGVAVYIPATYPPGLLRRSNLEETFIGNKLHQLEDDRTDAITQTELSLQALADAKQLKELHGTPEMGAQKSAEIEAGKSAALRFKYLYENKINAGIAALASIVQAIDNFEATLLTGQASAAPSPKPKKEKTADSPAPGPPNGPKPLAPPPHPADPAPSSDDADDPASPEKATSASTSTLPQILLADLLAHQIWNGVEAPDAETLNRLHILVLQTLESGGGQLTRSSLFSGSRIYFSGGAVSTFSLYSVDGAVECGGYAYAYRGYIKNSEFTKALDANTAPSGAVETNCRK